jgi:hypothetical protein
MLTLSTDCALIRRSSWPAGSYPIPAGTCGSRTVRLGRTRQLAPTAANGRLRRPAADGRQRGVWAKMPHRGHCQEPSREVSADGGRTSRRGTKIKQTVWKYRWRRGRPLYQSGLMC